MKQTLKENGGLPASILWTLSIVAGITVANLYYNQPLLNMIRQDLHVSEVITNLIAMVTQIGYAMGLLFVIPLGDMFQRKKIIIINFSIFHCFIKNNAYSCTERILVLFILSSCLYLFGFLNSFYLIINALIVSIPCCICCQCLCIYKYCDSKYRQQMRISFIFHFITIPFNNLQTLNRRHKNSLLQLVTNMLQIVTD